MIPILFDHSETAFTSNGICRLVDCIKCEVTEERNGIYECEFEYPITGRHYDDIIIDRIIYVTHDDSKEPQPFDIYKRSAPINGIVTFNAHHISYRLGNILLNPFTATSCVTALAQFNNYSMTENPFTFHTDKDVVSEFSITIPVSIKKMLGGTEGSILDVYGTGEYEFNKFRVDFWRHRGNDNGVVIRYADSLSDLKHELDYSSSYNTVVPFWANMDKTEIVTLPEKYVFSNSAPTISNNWTEDGTPITDDSGNIIEFMTTDGKAVPLDLSDAWEEPPTEEQLRAKGLEYLNNSRAWLPTENLKVDFIALWQTDEYANVAPLQTVNLCDTVTVLYPELGVDTTVKVIKTVYNTLLDRYSEIELGEPVSSFAETVTAQASAEVKESPSFLSSIAGEVMRATNKITGVDGGYVVIDSDSAGHPYQILIMDAPDKESAVNVMRINNAGIGFSTNGYNGVFTSAWTLDGHFVADFITAGTLNANLIRTGIIQGQSGGNFWNLDSGEFYTNTNDRGVNIKDGRVYFYDPNDADFNGYLTTGQMSVDDELDDTTADPVTDIGLFSTSEWLEFGTVDAMGNKQKGVSIYTPAVGLGDVPWGEIYARSVKASTVGNYVEAKYYVLSRSQIKVSSSNVPASAISDINRDNSVYGLWSDGYYVGTRLNVVDTTYPGDGVIRCRTLTQTSDERLKDVLEWDDRYIDALDDIEPVLYKWINGESGVHAGFIAQKVKQALEEHGLDPIGIVEDGEYLTLHYDSIFSLLMAKVKRQQKKIEDLETRLERLEKILCE